MTLANELLEYAIFQCLRKLHIFFLLVYYALQHCNCYMSFENDFKV